MNIRNRKGSLKLGAVVLFTGLLSACAYDPSMESSDEFQTEESEEKSKETGAIGVDVLVSERLVLKSFPEKIRRLTILENSVLETGGANLKLDIEEIVSFGGSIDTTPKTSLLGYGTNGTDGGSLSIKARRGKGNLKIIAGGQDGNTGAKGSTGTQGSKGGTGQNGLSQFECLFSLLTPFDRDPGGPGRCIKSWYCSRDTGNGAQGGQGTRGSAGFAGGNGGNSSPVLIVFDDPTGIEIHTEVRPGIGGLGGEGGNGGIGGPGGDPGSRDSRNACREASRGPQGPQGPVGPQGPNGKSGNENPICLKLGNAQIGDCRDFNNMTQ